MADSPSVDTNAQAQPTDPAQQSNIQGDQQAAGTPAAEDSGATADREPSLDDVIKAAIDKGRKEADSPSDGGKGSDPEQTKVEGDASKPDAEAKADDDEDDANLPFHKHPRWQKQLKLRREAEAKVKEYETRFQTEFEPLKAKADGLDRIGDYMRTNGLTPSELDEGFAVMALMKNDPAKALEMLLPKIELLELATGKRLPEDIRRRVDDGEVAEDAAQELARLRMQSEANKQNAEALRQQIEQRTQADFALELKSAADAQEREIAQRDPDFQHKKPFVIDRFRVLADSEPPQSKQDVSRLITKAYDDVSAAMRAVIKPQPTAPVIRSDQSTTRTTAQPQSLQDVVRAHISR